MDLSISAWMMILFLARMVLGIWKLYKFMPTKKLEDDHTGEDSHQRLVDIIHKVLADMQHVPSIDELHKKMTEHENFNQEKFWRFNQNKLNQLLNKHYLRNKHLSSIKDIHEDVHSQKH